MLSQKILQELKLYIEAQLADLKVYHSVDYLSMPRAMDAELDDWVNRHKKPGFSQTLFKMIDGKGEKDSAVYTRAGLDRRHFSKIRSNQQYQPSKTTAIALALALKLERDDADLLLASAGYTLSDSETFDLIIAWCLEKGVYDLTEVNQALDYFSQKTIGTIA